MTKSGRVTKKISVFNIVNALIMILLTVLFVLPFWLIITASLSSNSILMREGFSIFFRGFTFAGYKFLFSIGDAFLRALFVTVAVAVAATAISVFGCTWAAFALSNKKLVGRKFFNVFFMIPMFFSGGTITTYLVIRGIGLYDTIWALIIPGSIGAYNILLLRNYFYGAFPLAGRGGSAGRRQRFSANPERVHAACVADDVHGGHDNVRRQVEQLVAIGFVSRSHAHFSAACAARSQTDDR